MSRNLQGRLPERGGFLGSAGWVGLSKPPCPCSLPPGVLGSPLISLLFWILICFSIAALFTKRYSIRPLIVALILRSIYYLGIGPTLNILGALNVSARGPPPPTPTPSWACHAAGPEAGLLLCPFPLVPVLGSQAHYRPEAGTTLSPLSPGQLGAAGTQSQPARSRFGAPASGLLGSQC